MESRVAKTRKRKSTFYFFHLRFGSGGQGTLYFFYNPRKRFRPFLGEEGEDFAVERDVVFFECMYEVAVRYTRRPRGGIYFYLPETTKITLLFSPVCEGVLSGMRDRLARLALFCASAEAIAFDATKYISPTL